MHQRTKRRVKIRLVCIGSMNAGLKECGRSLLGFDNFRVENNAAVLKHYAPFLLQVDAQPQSVRSQRFPYDFKRLSCGTVAPTVVYCISSLSKARWLATMPHNSEPPRTQTVFEKIAKAFNHFAKAFFHCS